MRRIEALLFAAFERNVGSDERATLEDQDLVGEHVHAEDAAPGRVGNAVEIAADAHHACGIRGKAATDSEGKRRPNPIESGHLIRTKAATLLKG
jgi:hypothetical protein